MQKWMLIQSDLTEVGDAALFDRWKGRDGSLLWVALEEPVEDVDHDTRKSLEQMSMVFLNSLLVLQNISGQVIIFDNFI